MILCSIFGLREEHPMYEGHADLFLPHIRLDRSKNLEQQLDHLRP